MTRLWVSAGLTGVEPTSNGDRDPAYCFRTTASVLYFECDMPALDAPTDDRLTLWLTVAAVLIAALGTYIFIAENDEQDVCCLSPSAARSALWRLE